MNPLQLFLVLLFPALSLALIIGVVIWGRRTLSGQPRTARFGGPGANDWTADLLAGVQVDTAPAAAVLAKAWRNAQVQKVVWDSERGSLVLTADGTTAALAVEDRALGGHIESMITLERTNVTGFARRGRTFLLHFESESWQYLVAPMSVVLHSVQMQ